MSVPKGVLPEFVLGQDVATAYGRFDRIFVNGAPTKSYLETVSLGALGGVSSHPQPNASTPADLDLGARTTVVASRGVPADFCDAATSRPESCAAVPAAAATVTSCGVFAATSPPNCSVSFLSFSAQLDVRPAP